MAAPAKASGPVARQYMTFFLAEEEYGIEILRVREVVEHSPVTVVPGMPPCIRGVINLRGSVIPVVDLSVKFGYEPRPVTRWSCLVLVEVDVDGEPTAIGLFADAVSQVLEVEAKDIEAAPTFGTRVRADFLAGMARVDKKFALLLDVDRLLTIDELLSIVSATAREGAP